MARRTSWATLSLACAALFVASRADAFCRTTTVPLPPSYNPARGCFTDGQLLFWRNRCVSYSINENGSASAPYPEARRVIDAAFETWGSVECSAGRKAGISASNLGPSKCAEVRFNLDSGNQNLIVFRDQSWPYNDGNATLGLTTVTFESTTGEIFDADMEINATGRNLSTTEIAPSRGYDLLSVMTHEIGHFYGLAHSMDASATMYRSYKPGTTALRSLTDDDRAGLCAIYPDEQTRVVSSNVSANQTIEAPSCDPTPRGGFCVDCVSPKTEDGGCSIGTGRLPPSWASVSAMVMVMGAVFWTRRRARRAKVNANARP